jgi:hypothetical protein
MSEWQPIETAPRDGTRVWLFCPWDRWVGSAAWRQNVYHNGEEAWSEDDGESAVLGHDPPTHWMPLPKPPVTSSPIETPNIDDEQDENWLGINDLRG